MVPHTVFIQKEAQAFIFYKQFYPSIHTSPFCISHRRYLLYNTEPLCLFEPRHLYEPCFYLDKYGNWFLLWYWNSVNAWFTSFHDLIFTNGFPQTWSNANQVNGIIHLSNNNIRIFNDLEVLSYILNFSYTLWYS